MLPGAHGHPKPLHLLQNSSQSWLGRPIPSSNARSRSIVQQAEPNDVQIVDKPVLRRPEPPKPGPSQEEVERKRAAQRAALEKVERASRNGKGQSQQGQKQAGPRQGQQPQSYRARDNGASKQNKQSTSQGGRGGRGDRAGQQRGSQSGGRKSEARQPLQTQASAAPAPPTEKTRQPAEKAETTLRSQPDEAQDQEPPQSKPKPNEEDMGLIGKPVARPSQPTQQPALQMHRGQTKFAPPELQNRKDNASGLSAQATPAQAARDEGNDSALRKEEEDATPVKESDSESESKEIISDDVTEEATAVAAPEASPASQNGVAPEAESQEKGPQIPAASEEQVPSTSEIGVQEVEVKSKEPIQEVQNEEVLASSSGRSEIKTEDTAESPTASPESQSREQEEAADLLKAPQLERRPLGKSRSQSFDRSRSFKKFGSRSFKEPSDQPEFAPQAERSQDEDLEAIEEEQEEPQKQSAATENGSEGQVLAAKPEPLMAKPTREPAQQPPSRVLRRMPSDRRPPDSTSSGNNGNYRQQSQGSNFRAGPQADQQAPAKEGTGREKKRGEKPTRKRFEKPDIEKLRQSRYERRQQRQERNEAEAIAQEEIFEVGSEGMLVQDLANKLACNSGDVLKALFMKGIMAQVNQVLDKDMVKAVAEEYGVEVLDLEEAGLEKMAEKKAGSDKDEDAELLVPRPPVVTVMGHVDHGKTSLLDFIRKTKVAAGEAGGITQAIGAYTCQVESGEGERQITFIDTPGHEAFTAMRARGAKVTDIVIIIVACDDGVRPQTKEAIGHAKAAKVPIIVALNKVDKEGASPERAKQEISEAGLLPEEWGGDTPMVEISAKKGTGIDDLLETVLLLAELEQLSANPTRAARGTVVEANMHPRMGPVATLLVAAGTMRTGDVFHAGAAYGKVRVIKDSANKTIEEAGPSVAMLVVGLNSVPVAGDEFTVMDSEQEARKVAAAIEESQRLARLDEQAGGTMVTGVSFATMDSDEGEGLQYLNVILKADASGSLEAVKAALLSLPQDRVTLRFLMTAAGPINSGDVQLANASQGQIISFNLDPSEAVIAQAKRLGVAIKAYKVIYELIDDVRALMEGRLSAVEERQTLGEAEVRAVFGSGSRRVAGCMVTEGLLRKGCLAVIMRNRKQMHEGELTSLRRVKENITEIAQGNECGVGVADFIEWKEGDKIQAVEVISKRQTLEEASQRELTSNLQSWEEEEEFEMAGRR